MGNGYIDSYASGRFITDVISKIRQIIVKVKKNSEDIATLQESPGGASTLSEVLQNENITDAHDIELTDGDRLVANVNRAGFGKGYNDTEIGGSGGVSFYCAAEYELNWQAGWLANYYGSNIVPIMLRSPLSFTMGSYLASVNGTVSVSPDTRELYDELGGSILTWTSSGVSIGTSSTYGNSKLTVQNGGIVIWNGGTLLDASGNNHGHDENVGLTVDGKTGYDIFKLRNANSTNLFVVDEFGATIISSSLTTDADATIHGVRIGRGGGNVSSNIVIGSNNFVSNTNGTSNVSIGHNAGESNTTGTGNVFVGRYSGAINSTGTGNTAIGYGAMYVNSTGGNNTAVGYQALNVATIGYGSTAIGYQASKSATTGDYGVAIGAYALYSATTGQGNIGIGYNALYDVTTGASNLVIGSNSGRGITTGSNNTIIGNGVVALSAGLSNNIIIADGSGNRRINVDSSGNVGIGTTAQTSKLHVVGLPVYADNTAALGGGLTAGAFYRTSAGVLMIAY